MSIGQSSGRAEPNGQGRRCPVTQYSEAAIDANGCEAHGARSWAPLDATAARMDVHR